MAYASYQLEVRHDGLNKYRMIRGTDPYVVEQKARAQVAAWEEMWQRKLQVEANKEERQRVSQDKENKKEEAAQRTQEAVHALQAVGDVLKHTLSVNDAVDWESLKDKSPFPVVRPQRRKPTELPVEPKADDSKYKPKLTPIVDSIFLSRMKRKCRAAASLFEHDHKQWLAKNAAVEQANRKEADDHRDRIAAWEQEKREWLKSQAELNDNIEKNRARYVSGEPSAIEDYCDLVLSRSKYPDYFPQEFSLAYHSEAKTLVVDYDFPSPDVIPRLAAVSYVQSRDEFRESYLSDSQFQTMYDELLYEISLRSIHELYEADVIGALLSVVFNGWVRSINKSTGREAHACILSVQAGKEEFLSVNLANVDAKACFRVLKGVGSSKLHSLTPIAPILRLDREDARFVAPHDVANTLDESSNLAAMDWEEFEHLIRELFEKEFSQSGGEVKVTRASRDGGVDAVAFDPDPIRGGKIVIQAKRYTKTVGVSAVRDLYGTLLNEGATKGILVTTADYGPDAYEFAKGKPLTLLNGSNLLHLLQKHGTKAKIDLKAARALLLEREREEREGGNDA